MKNIKLSRILWSLAFLPIAAAIVWFGVLKPAQTAPTRLTTLTAENAQVELASPTVMVITVCTPDICELQRAELEKAAELLEGRVKFLLLTPVENPQIYMGAMEALSQAVGQPVPKFFPMHILIDANGSPLGMLPGLNPAAGIKQWVDMMLAMRDRINALPAPQTGANGTATEGSTTPDAVVPPVVDGAAKQ